MNRSEKNSIGMCVETMCPFNAVPGKMKCQPHLDADARYIKEYRAKQKAGRRTLNLTRKSAPPKRKTHVADKRTPAFTWVPA